MTTAAGLPRTPPQRPPLRRGAKEAIVALAALPVLVATGVYVGGKLGSDGPSGLLPAKPAAAGTRSAEPSPLVTVRPATPQPVVTVKPAAPAPVATVQAPAPSPVVTVRPATPGPVVTVQPPAPRPVVTVQPPAPRPISRAPAPAAPAPATPAAPPAAVAPVAPPAAPAAVLGRGSAGVDVRRWQEQMARRGWRIRVDGIFGPQTASVARRFQRVKGLRVDGLVGRETWSAAWRLPVRR